MNKPKIVLNKQTKFADIPAGKYVVFDQHNDACDVINVDILKDDGNHPDEVEALSSIDKTGTNRVYSISDYLDTMYLGDNPNMLLVPIESIKL
jgi:hypothetical protein